MPPCIAPSHVCRLIDTRGNPAAIAIAGPLAANSTTNVNSAGFCGIPNNGEVAGISLSFHVFNTTVNNGGYISFLQQGAAISGTNAVFNPGAQWTAATATYRFRTTRATSRSTSHSRSYTSSST